MSQPNGAIARNSRIEDQTIDLSSVELKLNKFRKKVKANLDSLTIEQKRMALDALEVNVIATPSNIEIKASVPLDIGKGKSVITLMSGC